MADSLGRGLGLAVLRQRLPPPGGGRGAKGVSGTGPAPSVWAPARGQRFAPGPQPRGCRMGLLGPRAPPQACLGRPKRPRRGRWCPARVSGVRGSGGGGPGSPLPRGPAPCALRSLRVCGTGRAAGPRVPHLGRARKLSGRRGASCLRLHFADGTAGAGRGQGSRRGGGRPGRGEPGRAWPRELAAAPLVGLCLPGTHFPSGLRPRIELLTRRPRRGPGAPGHEGLRPRLTSSGPFPLGR